MGIKMEIKREVRKAMDDKHYVVQKDYEKEVKRVHELNKQLQEHERQPLGIAHPIPSLNRKNK